MFKTFFEYLMVAVAAAFLAVCVTLAIVKTKPTPVSDETEIYEFQKTSAKLVSRWEICGKACWPGTMGSFDPKTDICVCLPACER